MPKKQLTNKLLIKIQENREKIFLLMDKKQHQEAIKSLDELNTLITDIEEKEIGLHPTRRFIVYQKALCMYYLSEYAKVIELLNSELQKPAYEHDMEAKLLLAEAYIEEKKYKPAEKLLKQLLGKEKIDGYSKYITDIKGMDSKDEYTELLEQTYELLGNIKLKQKNVGKAINYYNEGMCYDNLMELHWNNGNFIECKKIAEKAINHVSPIIQINARYYLAKCLYEEIMNECQQDSVSDNLKSKIKTACEHLLEITRRVPITKVDDKNRAFLIDVHELLASLADNDKLHSYNPAVAQSFYTVAKTLGSKSSAYILGTKILKENPEKGFELISKAAKEGHSKAAYELSLLYLTGKGCDANFNSAKHWVLEAEKSPEVKKDAKALLACILHNQIIDVLDAQENFDSSELRNNNNFKEAVFLLRKTLGSSALDMEIAKAANSALGKSFEVLGDEEEALNYYYQAYALGAEKFKPKIIGLETALLEKSKFSEQQSANEQKEKSPLSFVPDQPFASISTSDKDPETGATDKNPLSTEKHEKIVIQDKISKLDAKTQLSKLFEIAQKSQNISSLASQFIDIGKIIKAEKMTHKLFSDNQKEIDNLLEKAIDLLKDSKESNSIECSNISRLVSAVSTLFQHGYSKKAEELLDECYSHLSQQASSLSLKNISNILSANTQLALLHYSFKDKLQPFIDSAMQKLEESTKIENNNLGQLLYTLVTLHHYQTREKTLNKLPKKFIEIDLAQLSTLINHAFLKLKDEKLDLAERHQYFTFLLYLSQDKFKLFDSSKREQLSENQKIFENQDTHSSQLQKKVLKRIGLPPSEYKEEVYRNGYFCDFQILLEGDSSLFAEVNGPSHFSCSADGKQHYTPKHLLRKTLLEINTLTGKKQSNAKFKNLRYDKLWQNSGTQMDRQYLEKKVISNLSLNVQRIR